MKHILAATIVLALALPAWGQDLEKGMQAFQRGDYETALRELLPLAEQGDAEAQYYLGGSYVLGLGVPQDDAEAANWFRKAADQGYAKAQYYLGVIYSEGSAVPQDDAEAANWYRRAADQGYAEAQFMLGSLYGLGLACHRIIRRR